jgi:tetratricopeptide (TPR) repeat protein
MKAGALLACVVLITASVVFAQSPEQVFEQANQLYQQGKFTEAAAAFETIVRNGYANGELYYNLGNAYYKIGNIARAILNYERALKLVPNDDDLRHNLQLANLLITDKMDATPRLFVWDYWDSVKAAFSIVTITWLTYGVYVAVIASLCLVFVARTYRGRKSGLLGSAGCSFLLVLLLIVFLGKVSDIGRRDVAIVMAEITTIKNSPDAKSSDAFVLHSGVKIQVTDNVSDWIKIRLADGKVGWMERGAAESI